MKGFSFMGVIFVRPHPSPLPQGGKVSLRAKRSNLIHQPSPNMGKKSCLPGGRQAGRGTQ